MIEYVGQKLGNYRLIKLLGRGGFADVYLGEHIYLQTPAAIKVLQMRLTDEASGGVRTRTQRALQGRLFLPQPHLL